MAAPIDWTPCGGIDSVKQLTQQLGPREAARRLCLSDAHSEALRRKCSREGWMDAVRPQPVPMPPSMRQSVQVTVPDVPKASDALADAMLEHSKKARMALARAGRAAAEHFSSLDGQEIALEAQNFKHIVTSNDQIHGWTAKTAQNSAGVLVNVNLMTMLASDFAPAIEVTAEVTPLSRGDMAETGQDAGEE